MNDKVIDRIEELMKYYNLTIAAFEREIGASNNSIGSALKRRAYIKDKTIIRILNRFPEVSTDWLVLGKGTLTKGFSDNEEQVQYFRKCEKCENKDEIIKMKNEMLLSKNETIEALKRENDMISKQIKP